MSRDVVRATMRALVVVLGFGKRAPELARREEQLADLRRAPRRGRSARCVALSARPSAPKVSCWRAKSSGIAIERYWWMRASAIGCSRTSRALRLRRLERRLAVGDPVRVAREHLDDLLLGEAGARARCAARSGATAAAARTGSRTRRRSARAARDGRSSSRSIGLQTEVSKKTPALPAKWPASPERSAMPACAMISCASG